MVSVCIGDRVVNSLFESRDWVFDSKEISNFILWHKQVSPEIIQHILLETIQHVLSETIEHMFYLKQFDMFNLNCYFHF